MIGETNIKTHFDDAQLKELINFALHYFADLDIPVKRCAAPQCQLSLRFR